MDNESLIVRLERVTHPNAQARMARAIDLLLRSAARAEEDELGKEQQDPADVLSADEQPDHQRGTRS